MAQPQYQLVKMKERKFAKAPFVIVPVSYIHTNTQLQSSVRYLDPPYNDDDKDLIKDFVEKNTPPPESWTFHKCEVKGAAGSYEEVSKLFESFSSKNTARDVNTQKCKRRKISTFLNTVNTAEQSVKVEESDIAVKNGSNGEPDLNALLEVPCLDDDLVSESDEKQNGNDDLPNVEIIDTVDKVSTNNKTEDQQDHSQENIVISKDLIMSEKGECSTATDLVVNSEKKDESVQVAIPIADDLSTY